MPAALTPGLSTRVPITILHAPAGFGKTTAMEALHDQLLAEGAAVAWLRPEARRLAEDPLAWARTTIAGARIIFFDAAERGDRALLDAIVAIVLASPAERRLIVGTRRLDDLALARRIVEGTAQAIAGSALRWHRSQLAALWTSSLSPRQIDAVQALAEGWPAASQLLARWSSDGGQIDEAGLFLRPSLVSSYIDDEVLSCFAAVWRPVMAASAVSDTVDQALLDRLSGGGLRLDDLLAGLQELIVPTGQAGEYRYNRLLRRHLKQAIERRPAGERDAASAATAEWALDRGDVVLAATLTSRAGAPARIADYARRAGGLHLWLMRGYDDIRALVDLAGSDMVAAEPRLQLLRCVVLLKDGRAGEADRAYAEAMLHLPDDAEARRDAALVQATLLIYGCRAASARDAGLYELLEQFDGGAWRTMLPTIRAIRHSQQAQFAPAMAAIAEARSHARAAGIGYNLMYLDLHAAGVALAQGELTAARASLGLARRRWTSAFTADHGAETVLSALSAQLAFEGGQDRQAARHLRKSALRLPHSEAWLDIYVAAFEPMLRLLAAEHDARTALAAIERIGRQLHAQSLGRIADMLTAIGVAIAGEALLDADPGASSALPAGTLPPTDKTATWQEQELGTLAAAYRAITAGRPDEALALIEALARFAVERSLRRTHLRALLMRVAILDRLGRPAEADRRIDEAIAIGAATGMRQAFREFGGVAVGGRIADRQASAGAGAIGDFVRSLPLRPNARSATAEVPLTRRERQVLDGLAGGGSDKQIGRNLAVTEHAVRFHLKNIYAKLQVHDRAGALAAASAKPTR